MSCKHNILVPLSNGLFQHSPPDKFICRTNWTVAIPVCSGMVTVESTHLLSAQEFLAGCQDVENRMMHAASPNDTQLAWNQEHRMMQDGDLTGGSSLFEFMTVQDDLCPGTKQTQPQFG
jgi:hypothetical protein